MFFQQKRCCTVLVERLIKSVLTSQTQTQQGSDFVAVLELVLARTQNFAARTWVFRCPCNISSLLQNFNRAKHACDWSCSQGRKGASANSRRWRRLLLAPKHSITLLLCKTLCYCSCTPFLCCAPFHLFIFCSCSWDSAVARGFYCHIQHFSLRCSRGSYTA